MSPLGRTLSARWPEMLGAPRLILAAKVAGASAIAWYLAPYIPFADSEYSYYAPLGVLISMYSTLAGSLKAGVQTLAGLAAGIGLGFVGLAVVVLGAPGIAAIALVTGVGTVLAGLRVLGAGRDWIPIAGLFVLLLGGADADAYSSSYLLTTAFGVLVGLCVNLLVVPPLYIGRATARLNVLRDQVGAAIAEAAQALGDRALEADRVHGVMNDIAQTTDAVADEVAEAAESRRGNPRARRRSAEIDLSMRRLQALQSVTGAAGELAEALTRLTHEDAEDPLADAERQTLAEALAACAQPVATPIDDASYSERLAVATEAFEAYRREVVAASGLGAAGSLDRWEVALGMRRLLDASRPFAESSA